MAILKDADGSDFQIISGMVAPDGTASKGVGFSVRRMQPGTYVIEFERPFHEQPIPVATIAGQEWHTFDKSIAVIMNEPNAALVMTSTDNRPVDCGFTFMVSGAI